jgi:hypothetical protein
LNSNLIPYGYNSGDEEQKEPTESWRIWLLDSKHLSALCALFSNKMNEHRIHLNLHLQLFEESNETFTNYLLRLNSYLEMKGFVGDGEDVDKKRVNTLIIYLGPKTFQLLTSLTAPDSPTSKTFEVLTK